MAEQPRAALDGRVLRSERSRLAIVRATYDLVGEGVLKPTAEQVAERAGVGIRTVFRHFSDMESLFAEMNALLRRTAGPIFQGGERTGTLQERVRGLVGQRVQLYEHIAPYRRSAGLSRWRSDFLQKQEAGFVRELREDLAMWLPELSREGALFESFDAAVSFEVWDRLRSNQRLGVARAREAMEHLALRLAGELA